MTTTSLDDLELPSDTVRVSKDATITVQGISFQDISILVKDYGPSLAKLYEKFVAEKDNLTSETVTDLIQFAFDEIPDGVALLIALAAGSKSARTTGKRKVARMPIPVQVEALEKIIALTFINEAEVKKLVETVTRMLKGVTSVMPTLTLPSETGNGSFASR